MIATLHNHVAACKLSEIPPRGKKIVTLDGVSVLIIASDAGLFAVENACPQTGRPLVNGAVLGRRITSPHTGAHYDLVTGRYIGGGQSPLQSHWLHVFLVRVVGDQVFVKLRT